MEFEQRTVTLELEIEPGTEAGTVITLVNEGEPHADGEPGDLHVELVLQPHSTFKREGMHLRMNKQISLVDALAGFKQEIEHVDGHAVRPLAPCALCCSECVYGTRLEPLFPVPSDLLAAQLVPSSSSHSILPRCCSSARMRDTGGQNLSIPPSTHPWPRARGVCSAAAAAQRTARPHLQVVLERTDVTEHGFVQRVRGEGMPRAGSNRARGDLIVTYSIKFPASLSAAQKEQVRALFG